MSNSQLSFLLFPIGIGEENVRERGEVPVLVSAVADTRHGVVGAATAPGMQNLRLQSQQSSRHVTVDDVPSVFPINHSSTPTGAQRSEGNVRDGVISLAAAPASTSPAASPPAPAELLCRMHYVAASHLCEVQRGAPLARCLPSPTSSATALLTPCGGFSELEGGQRCYYFCPVEDGQYLTAVCLPPSLWHNFIGGDGACIAHWLLHTTLTGHLLPLRALRSSDGVEGPSYTSLHTRLATRPDAVQKTMAAQVQLLARVGKQLTTAPHHHSSRATALRRLCQEDPSSLRAHPRLGQHVEELIRSAASSTSPASLRGVMPTMGLTDAEHRYVLSASALWYRGHPLCTSLTPAQQQQHQQGAVQSSLHSSAAQLRTGALAVMLEEAGKLTRHGRDADMSYHNADSTPVRVTAQCFATAPRRQAISSTCVPANGYISQPLFTKSFPQNTADNSTSSARQPCGVSMAFSSTSGWTVVLLLQPVRTPYIGSPLSTIFNGVQRVVADDFERDDFVNLVREATSAMRCTWQRPLHMVSPLVAQLEAAVRSICVRRRLPGTAAASQDRVLYSLYTASSTPSPKRSASPFSALRRTKDNSKGERTRKAALIASYAEAQQRYSLTESDTAHAGRCSAEAEAVVQTAMRYVHLMARIQRCCRGWGTHEGATASYRSPLHVSPQLLLGQRSRAVFSVLTEGDTVRFIKAVPHGCNVVAAPTSAPYAVTYVVVEVDKIKMPALDHDACSGFTSWILSKCI